MTDQNEQRIRELAHRIWESEGCPQGEDMRHWHMAERLIAAGEAAQAIEAAPMPKPRRPAAARSTSKEVPARAVRHTPASKGKKP